MVVVSVTNCPPKLRGDLSKWLLEINTGVYIGNVSARVRDALWKRICDNISDGQATMVFNAQNEQHMDFYVHNTSWKPVDFDGIKLMLHPDKSGVTSSYGELKQGFSIEAKRRMGKRRRANTQSSSYVLIDIETSGLSAEHDDIIEIGVIEVVDNTIFLERNWLIKTGKKIDTDITQLTGIDNDMLADEGVALIVALTELFDIIADKEVMIYNASFDMSFLEKGAKICNLEFPDIRIKDLFIMAKSRVKNLDNYKLQTVASNLGINAKQTHRALSDCHLLIEVVSKLNEI